MATLIEKIDNAFREQFGREGTLVISPGRVNLIGEHTDYNDGFVLPAAVDKVIVLSLAPNLTDSYNLVSVDKEETYEHPVDKPFSKTGLGWPDYILAVIDQLRKRGDEVGGFDCVFGGDIPIGAGMSSSAALEGGVIKGLAHLFGLEIPTREMALMAQRAENDFVGVQCGIMDQFVNIHGREEHALKLDCRTLDYELYPFSQEEVHIVLCDTQVRRELAGSEYNIRRSQCEEGVEILQEHGFEVDSLRDADLEMLDKASSDMEEVIYRRCRYVIEENRRVLDGCGDLEAGDIRQFGQRMYASHAGLRDEYEVSCRELDLLVELAEPMEGVLGSRMMGGGFGGCTINLVEKEQVEGFATEIQSQYEEAMGTQIKVYRTRIGGGVRLVS